MNGFTDITRDGWIRRLPAKAQPYARLMRLDRPIGTWLLLLPCWWGTALAATDTPDVRLMLFFALGTIIMRGAGCTINDIYDRDLDGRVERTRTRPLPSGEVTLTQALVFLAAQLAAGLAVLLTFNGATIVTGACSLILVFTYPLMKRVTWWPQFFLGLAFNWGMLLGSTAVTGHISRAHLLGYAAGIGWTLAYDTIYAHQDARDDATVGIKSTARLFGQHTRKLVAFFYGLAFVLLVICGAQAGLGLAFYPILAVAGLYVVHLLMAWQPDEPADCLARFRANRDVGLIILAAIIAGKML